MRSSCEKNLSIIIELLVKALKGNQEIWVLVPESSLALGIWVSLSPIAVLIYKTGKHHVFLSIIRIRCAKSLSDTLHSIGIKQS